MVDTLGAVERLRQQLTALILSGELQPGERLNELALSSRFNIGRAHLREAVRALEEARLVRVVANRGAHVRSIDLAEALELFDVRAGLARSAGRLAALRAAPAQIKDIQLIHTSMGAAASKSDLARFHELNHDFHDRLMSAAANERLSEIDLAVRNELQLYIRHNVGSAAHLRISHEEHGLIVSALLKGDGDACGSAFEQHILNGKRRLMDRAPPARPASPSPG